MAKFPIDNDIFEKIVKTLKSDLNVKAVTLLSRDGLMITHTLPKGIDVRLAAPMASALVGTAEKIVEEFHRGEYKTCIVESSRGYTLTVSAGFQYILVVIANRRADLKRITRRMKLASKRIKKLMQQTSTKY